MPDYDQEQSHLPVEAAMDRLSDGFMAMDRSWRLVYINSAASRLLEREPAGLIGRVVWEEVPSHLHSQFYEVFNRSMRDQTAMILEYKDRYMEHWYQFHLYPGQDGLSVFFHDITVMKRLAQGAEQYFSTLFDQHPYGVCALNTEWELQRVNQSFANMTGYEPPELIGHKLSRFLPLQDGYPTGDFALKAAGEGIQHCSTIIRKDGSAANLECSFLPVIVGADIVAYFGICKDITDRIITEKRLEESEQRYKSLSENAQDVILYMSPKGIVEYVSPSVSRLLGYEQSDWVGRHTGDIVKDIAVSEGPRRTDQCGASTHGAASYQIRHRNGDTIWCEITYKKIWNEQGELVRTVAVCRDISARRQAEEDLRRSKDNFVLAQQIAGLGHYEWYLVSGHREWSDETYRIFGYSREQFADAEEAARFIIHPEDLEMIQDMERQLLSGVSDGGRQSEMLEYEFRIRHGSGETRTIYAIARLLDDEDGRFVRLFGTVRDVTGHKQTEELLRKSEKLKMAGQLAAGIAHEIRNPLTSLKGFSKLQRHATGEQADRYYQIMETEFTRIEMILDELLVLAKPNAACYKVWDVGLLAGEVAELLSSQAILSNVVIQMETGNAPCLVNCDKNQLKQVFMNVIKNAIEAMPGGGMLLVATTAGPEHVMVNVTDSGAGIPADKLARLGEPFYTTKEKGTGLGLMVSLKIIEEHHGRMEFDSSPGRGTTVSIQLPAYQEGAAYAETS
ncbi:PAS domain-containing protein [Paenibacillus tarimensis]|uniref:PAS domain-containing protein n=1 Tax=Paenibacillus tarimensis TaxID=416012 RepID=UPI001F343EEC|nr:PAS domain-containing sensor histidine kinase [Paenibacillus tarimensis]MCF2944276.1 PAS domain S-box protein [Paenibacillus tarimensis]